MEQIQKKLSKQHPHLSVKLIRDIVNAYIETAKEEKNILYVENVMNTVSQVTGISRKQLKSKARKREIVRARYMAIGLIRKGTGLSQTVVGNIFSIDHSSVSAAERYFTNPPMNDIEFLTLKNKLCINTSLQVKPAEY